MAAITGTSPETEDTLVSVEEYIDRFVDGGEKPACEYVDGELFPKSMGTKKHSKTQQNIQYYIRQKYGEAFDPLPDRFGIGIDLEVALSRVVPVLAGHHFQKQRILCSRRCERAGVIDRRVHAHDAGVRHQAPGRLDADDA